ncbi:MAG TPA: alpha/beta hydrolase [Kribbella sp.]|uniref:alpha/beta hydrolase n=1 Tax=Kribbella sp. TaxID=1871183 RepID=UPI002D79AD01|nr:alpha/beta hydrolase [Kribbella sp.]HET6298464.1 alpha/beta hydrolase [Kribbella sp.]
MNSRSSVTIRSDISYGPDALHTLDLYRPNIDTSVPVVLYLHGGAWKEGDKTADSKERLEAFASFGVAVASANYRLVPDATYPAQIHDAKGAVRWLRANGAGLGLTTDRIAVWGASAGGYLASMVGLTNGDSTWEGSVGDCLAHDSSVAAVVDWFGQSDLTANTMRSWLEEKILPPPVEDGFLAIGDGTNREAVTSEASPLNHVTTGAPPFLIVHGDRDRVTPISESIALHDKLVRAGAESTFVTLGNAGHESNTFDRPDHLAITSAFLNVNLSGERS